jgi:hypothetical protein
MMWPMLFVPLRFRLRPHMRSLLLFWRGGRASCVVLFVRFPVPRLPFCFFFFNLSVPPRARALRRALPCSSIIHLFPVLRKLQALSPGTSRAAGKRPHETKAPLGAPSVRADGWCSLQAAVFRADVAVRSIIPGMNFQSPCDPRRASHAKQGQRRRKTNSRPRVERGPERRCFSIMLIGRCVCWIGPAAVHSERE